MKDYSRGRLYVAEGTSGKFVGHIKIGFTTQQPKDRVKQFGVPCRLVYETDVISDAVRLEKSAQRILALSGEHVWGEWFRATVEQGTEAIAIAIRQRSGAELPLEGKLKAGSDRSRSGVDKTASRLVTFRIKNDLLGEVDAFSDRWARDRGVAIAYLLRLGLDAENGRRVERRGAAPDGS